MSMVASCILPLARREVVALLLYNELARRKQPPDGDEMDLKLLQETPPWDWPRGVEHKFLALLRDPKADADDRLLAANLAGDLCVMSDALAEALLAIVSSATESEELRAKAAISLGPILEQADTDEFDDPDDVPISEKTFRKIKQSLRKVYLDTSGPKLARRRILEAAVRAPEEWHESAIRSAYASEDREWKLTAVFCMQYVRGFDDEILESLKNQDPDIHFHAVCAASQMEVAAAWPHVAALVTTPGTAKNLLLAAIEAVSTIRPSEAGVLLVDLADSEDEDIAEAVEEAMSMAEGRSDDDFDDFDEDEEDDDEFEGGGPHHTIH
jgi:hypothetical protein